MAVKPKRKKKLNKLRNPVAKNLHKSNKPSIQKDRSKYDKKDKSWRKEE